MTADQKDLTDVLGSPALRGAVLNDDVVEQSRSDEIRAAGLEVLKRARGGRLRCYHAQLDCPSSPGVTYECLACAEPLIGTIPEDEAALETMFLVLADLFGLKVRT